jgi:hypothetical protein
MSKVSEAIQARFVDRENATDRYRNAR